MKYLIISCVYLILLCGCQSNRCSVIDDKYFDPSEYALAEVLKDSEGVRAMELYRHKVDTNRYYTKAYWSNGNLQAMVFYTNKRKNGPAKSYDPSGKIDFEGMFLNDVPNGLSIYYKNGEVYSFSILHNGKELFLDSSVKTKMINGY